MKELQNHVEKLPERNDVINLGPLPSLSLLEKRNRELNDAIGQSLQDIKELLENSTSNQINDIKSRVDDFNAFQLSAISLLVNLMSSTINHTDISSTDYRYSHRHMPSNVYEYNPYPSLHG